MKNRIRLIYFSVTIVASSSLFLLRTVSLGQGLTDREYGVGIASVESPYQVGLTFYASPSKLSERAAFFQAESLTLFKEKTTVRSYNQMIEISYSEVGFPILAFSSDSEWVKVSLDCHDLKNRHFGWLSTKSVGLRIQSWSDILADRGALFFLKPQWMTFYSEPKSNSRVKPPLVQGNYQLYRKLIAGRWMQVELETPSSFCRTEEEVLKTFGVKPTKRVLWIQFLDERNRPRIFYFTRGC